MGQVVPFIARVRESGDWSAVERARLQDLAERLSASGIDVEVIFGATDEGDPWCVVTDGSGDVLIHVARIDGLFVVHSAVDDSVNESVDLHAALRDRLEATEAAIAPQSATVLPFGMTARQGQTFLALVVATAFFYETSGIADTAQAAEAPPESPAETPQPAPEDEAPTQERELATQGAVQPHTIPAPATPVASLGPPPSAPRAADARQEPQDQPPAAPPAVEAAPAVTQSLASPKAASEPAATVIRGTDGDDLLVGSAADEHILGGAGDDTLRGGGGNDLLEGGAGDDRIELAVGTTAIGGEGADTFVIATPTQSGNGNLLLGTILDFRFGDGDKLVLGDGRVIQIPPPKPVAPPTEDKTVPTDPGGEDLTGQGVDPPAPPTLVAPGGDFGTTQLNPDPPYVDPPPLTRVEIDFDGDGIADGFVLVGVYRTSAGASAPIEVTGGGLGGDDIFG